MLFFPFYRPPPQQQIYMWQERGGGEGRVWSLTNSREGDSFFCIQMMLNPTLSTLFVPPTPHPYSSSFSFSAFSVPFHWRGYYAVCYLICLPHPSFPSLFISFLSSFYRLLSPISPRTWIYLLLPGPISLSPTLSVSLFSSISPSFSLIFLRDNCVQALSSFSSLKRRLPSRHREAESAFQSSMMSRTPRPNPPPPKHSHTHNKSSTADKMWKADTTNNSVCPLL